MAEEYTELVRKLRNRRVCIQATGGLADYDLLKEAADAIEDLAQEVERARAFSACWEEMATDCKRRFETLVNKVKEAGMTEPNKASIMRKVEEAVEEARKLFTPKQLAEIDSHADAIIETLVTGVRIYTIPTEFFDKEREEDK